MKTLLIADDSQYKIDFLLAAIKISVSPDPIPIEIARTTEEAIDLLLSNQSIAAGFIDYEIPSRNGPHIIRAWRELEATKARPTAFICLETRSGGTTFSDYSTKALEAGADEAISLLWLDKNPLEAVQESLRKMLPFLRTEER
jgi:CheY-like chemotaxis protein